MFQLNGTRATDSAEKRIISSFVDLNIRREPLGAEKKRFANQIPMHEEAAVSVQEAGGGL